MPLLVGALILCAPALALPQEAKASSVAVASMTLPSVLSGATLVGRVASSTKLSLAVSVAPSNLAGLTEYGRAASDPSSENYHRFLSPTQVGERFGASSATINTVVSYLKNKGLTVTLTAKNRMAILVTGKVGAIESAFSTKINNYKVASRGDKGPLSFYSNASVPILPATFSSKIVHIDGLTNANPPERRSQLRPIDARTVYNTTPLYGASNVGGHKGDGINIGISNFDGYRLSFAAAFADAFGLPLPGGTGTNIRKVIVGGVDGETVNPGVEGDLDIQMVLGIAPRCNLFIYDGIGGGLLATLTREADDNACDIITESYGFRGDNAFFTAAHNQHLAMTAQGMTYMCASGDNGTSDLNTNLTTFLNFPYPDFDPDVLMVGGSEVTLDGLGGRAVEKGWTGSGSGWYPPNVTFNVLPPYQKGNGIRTDINKRLVPDIAVHATEWYISFNGSLINIGGTSAASPSFAGQLGVILQTLLENDAADTNADGRPRVGRIQDFIYPLVDAGSTAFLDLTTLDGASAGILPDGTTSLTTTRWDFVTGLGAPDDTALYTAFLNAGSISVSDVPSALSIYSNPAMPTGFGASPTGGATELPTADGISYTVQSVRQKGVGQIAAVTIPVNLQTAKQPRSASVKVVMTAPKLTTGTIYLLNKNTNQYDLISTVANTGSMTTTTIPLDVTAAGLYISANKVTMLVRGLKPSRLGNSPFTLTIDQAVVTEKVARD